MEALLQPKREIGPQDDQDALSDVDNLQNPKDQGQPRCHESIDPAAQDAEDDPLENECSDDGSPFLLRTTTAARLLDRSPCRLHVR